MMFSGRPVNATTPTENKKDYSTAVTMLEMSDSANDSTPSTTSSPLKLPQSPLQEENASLPPPLDQVTICSDDSATSYSSVSDTDDDNEDARRNLQRESRTRATVTVPRSIFNQYWAKNGGGPSLKRASGADGALSASPPSSIVIVQQGEASDEDDEDDANTYERSLRNNENDKPNHQQPPAIPQRRSIFQKNCLSKSTPLLNLAATTGMMTPATTTAAPSFRKTKSTSALRRRSCLRPCRYSPGSFERSRLTRSSSERSVNFDKQVKVALYEKSMERYAADGWSDYFA